MSEELQKRPIKSFVIRGGRMTPSQQNAFDHYWADYGLSTEDGQISTAEIFGNNNPLVFEIGFGMGHSLAEMAATDSESNYIGVEVHKPGVGALLRDIEDRKLSNLRAYWADANIVLNECIQNESLDRVQLYFPIRGIKSDTISGVWCSLSLLIE